MVEEWGRSLLPHDGNLLVHKRLLVAEDSFSIFICILGLKKILDYENIFEIQSRFSNSEDFKAKKCKSVEM